MTTITEIIGRVNTQLVDPMMVRWPMQELCDYYNDAVRAVILARPDAGASLETIVCVPGSRQTLPDGAIQLLDVICLSDGSAIKPLPREVLDAQYPDWQHSIIRVLWRSLESNRVQITHCQPVKKCLTEVDSECNCIRNTEITRWNCYI